MISSLVLQGKEKNSTGKVSHVGLRIGNDPYDLAVNPITNITYVTNLRSNTVSVIGGTTDSTLDYVTVGRYPTSVAVNPVTNRIFVTNYGSNTVSVIDGSTNRVVANVTVGGLAATISRNPITNIIYAINLDSHTISKINDTGVVAGITYNIQPQNAGHIKCIDKDNHDKEIPINTYVKIEFDTQCKAEANNGFVFSSWIENLGDNSSRTIITSMISNSPFDPLLNFLGFDPNDNSATLKVSKYGSFTANFNNAPPVLVPTEFWAPLYALIPGFFIPSIISWLNGRRQRGYLKQYIDKIGKLDKSTIEKEITELYTNGKISDAHHQMLKDKILEYYNDANKSQDSSIK